jgi:hypothetical protein
VYSIEPENAKSGVKMAKNFALVIK